MFERVLIKSYDSTQLVANYYEASGKTGALFVHGITSEKTEAGLYTQFAQRLFERGISSVSLDLRCHGESEGKQEDFILSGAINDICAGIYFLLSHGLNRLLIVSASFSGGLSIRATELMGDSVSHLILLNPRLTYTPWIKDPSVWEEDKLSKEAQISIGEKGYIERKGFKLGRAMVNELLSFDPAKGMASLSQPMLLIHGTEDTVIPIESTREKHMLCKNTQLIEITGAQHGFTDPASDNPSSLKSQDIRSSVIYKAINWVDANFM